MKRKITALLLAAAVCLCLTSCGQPSADNPSDSTADNSEVSYKHEELRTLTDCEIGEENGYGYELWKDNGTTSMTLMEDGNFSCEWSDINNALFRRGMKFDCTKTWQEIGSINLDYDVDYNPDGNSYLALYGWTRQPLVEYYIVESWGNWRPPGGSPTATVEIDGDPYDIYETTRYNQPSIDGNTTFQQYWCVRQEPRTKGTLKVGTAFATWEALGMPMGKLYEASLTVEGYQSRGSATIHKNILVIDKDAELPAPAKGAEPETADAEGYYVRSDFESGTDGWEQRGSSHLKQTSEAAGSGESSLKVSGRQDAWHGAARSLKPNTYTPGSTFSFGVSAMQNSKDTETFKLTLQYNANGATNYEGIASAEGKNGEWVRLENPSFTIPEGASGMILYVETDSGKADFYIDDAAIAVEGVIGADADSEAALNGLDYVLELDEKPIYDNVEIIPEASAENEALSYEDLAENDLPFRDNLRFIAFEIESVCSAEEETEIIGENSSATLYKAHVYYDFLSDSECDYDINIYHAGGEAEQYNGCPGYAVGHKYAAAVSGNETWVIANPKLEFSIYTVNGVELAYHHSNEEIKLNGDYVNLDLEMADTEKSVITTTKNNPAVYTQKSTVSSLGSFIRDDWNSRGLAGAE